MTRKEKLVIFVIVSLVVIVSLLMGVFYIRSYMMKQTTIERSSQLEEMISQIRANMDAGMETHWNLVEGMKTIISGKHYSGEDELREDISNLEKNFCTELYGCRVMLIDYMGTAHTTEGDEGIWDDIGRLADGEEKHSFISDTRNLDGTFLVLAQKIDKYITVGEDEIRFTHIALLKDVKTLKKYYTTESYGGNAATYIIKKNGILAYYDAEDDIIGVRNIIKALEKAQYLGNRSFSEVMQQLDEEGVVAANILHNGTEYYYCLATLREHDMDLMLLIPAEYVAASTMEMMNSIMRVQIIVVSAIAVLILVAVTSLVMIRRSKQMVRIEQKNNQELNRLRVVAEEANRAKSAFLSNMSHDIRTPMNAVIGFATLALSNVNNTEKVKDYLNKILSSGNHLLCIINDILDMSRIESGKIQIDEQKNNLLDILFEIKDIIGEQIKSKQLKLHINMKNVVDENVYCDRTRLNQVLINLLSNSIKFTLPGGLVSLCIIQFPSDSEGMGLYEIHIRDTGIGMSTEFVDKIFEPFEREQSSTVSKIQGTGLGMSISKKIIEMMGGTIIVNTEKDKGTEFVIRLSLRLQEK